MNTDEMIQRAQDTIEELGCRYDCIMPSYKDGEEIVLFTDLLTVSTLVAKLKDLTRETLLEQLQVSRSKGWLICDRLRERGLCNKEIAGLTREQAIEILETKQP